MTAVAKTRALLMPKSIASWLVEETTLSFQQIADFCGLHMLEVQAIANGDQSYPAYNPVDQGYLTADEITKGEQNGGYRLVMRSNDLPEAKLRAKGPRYTPIAKRGEKPDAISWLIKNHPELPDAAIIRLIGTTKNTIAAIKNRSHANMINITPRNPVLLGLCRQDELEAAVRKAGGKINQDTELDSTQAEEIIIGGDYETGESVPLED